MNAHDVGAFEALFDPRGVIVAGASSHPGKFGFVVLHNILRHEYAGKVFATNVDGGEILGVTAHPSVECIPDGAADLVFVCTPVRVNADVVRDCARKGVRAAFVMTGGYAESGDAGRRAEHELAAAAEEAGVLLAGPNGQGIVSTPSSLCAQMVAPYPPAGRIGVASQSGNIVSTFENLRSAPGSASPAPSPRATRRWSRWPTTSSSSPPTPRPTWASRTSKACATGARCSTRCDAPRASSRSCWCTADPRRGVNTPPRRTPARSPPTTGSSRACAGRPG